MPARHHGSRGTILRRQREPAWYLPSAEDDDDDYASELPSDHSSLGRDIARRLW